jgi:transcriptional regulator with XRE-family HTH domain
VRGPRVSDVLDARFTRGNCIMEVREPGPVDTHVGQRVRMRRLLANMSQVELGSELGVTFQQVQKYEKGTNRIGSSRLHRISQVLEVPVSFFFEDVAGQKRTAALPDYLVRFMGTSHGRRMVQGLARSTDKKLRGDLLELIESIADKTEVPEKKLKSARLVT